MGNSLLIDFVVLFFTQNINVNKFLKEDFLMSIGWTDKKAC